MWKNAVQNMFIFLKKLNSSALFNKTNKLGKYAVNWDKMRNSENLDIFVFIRCLFVAQ